MTFKKLFLTTLTLIIGIAFAGCEAKTVQPTEVSSTQITQVPPAISATDQANYQAAFQLKDVSYCEKISDESYKKDCKTEMADGLQLADALKAIDSSKCDKLSTKDRQDACKVQIEVIKKEADEKKAQADQITADQKLMAEIVKSKDYARCKELKLDSSKYDCEMNILSNKSLETKDISWCEKGSSEEIKSACKSLYNQSIEPTKTQS